MELFTVEKNDCTCHPETCSCNDYKITIEGVKICTGNDELGMKNLALRANLSKLLDEKHRKEQEETEKMNHMIY